MDSPDIIETLCRQLPVETLLACTTVSKLWSEAACLALRSRCWTFDERDSLPPTCRALELKKTHCPHSLVQYATLTSLTIHGSVNIATTPPPMFGGIAFLMVQLSDILSNLSSLKHLHIHGQDLRVRRLVTDLLGGTDAGLLALRAARVRRGLPGLVSLTITSSPDLTTAALIAYLSSTSLEQQPAFTTDSLPDVPLDHAHCGFALRALTLINCTKTGAADALLLPALQRFCPNLTSLTLKKVDHLFEAPPASSSNAGSSFPLLRQLSRLSLSTNSSLDTRYFDAFRLTHSALRELTLVSCRHISAEHLASFTRVNKLVISGCPAITDIPTALMPELREISWLGTGISVSSAHHLFRHGRVRRISQDAAAATSGWDGRAGPALAPVPARAAAHSSCRETDDLPVALLPFRKSSLLASDLPSWALVYLLAHAPASLESFALHGAVVPAASGKPGQEGSLIPKTWRYPHLYFEDEDLKRMNTPWGLPRALCRIRVSEETRLGWGAWLASWVVPAQESKEGAGSGSSTRRLRRPPMTLPLRYLMPSVSHMLWPDSSDFASIGNPEHQPQPRTKRALSQLRCFPIVPQQMLSDEGASSAQMGRTASEPARDGSERSSPVDPDGTVLEAERLACLLALPGKLHVPPTAVHASPFLLQNAEHPAHERVSEEQMHWLRQYGKGSILRLDI